MTQRTKARPMSAAALRRVERRGLSRYGLRDFYHTAMTVRLSVFLGGLAAAFVLINLVFAGIYCAIGGLAGVGGGFGRAFFFSVQTLSTTGYGAVYPVSVAANLTASAEMLMGLLGTALATGVLFARLSRPRARVLFSAVMVVRAFKGVPTLMFRLVNERRNQVTEARVALYLTREEADGAGGVIRRMVPMNLERTMSPVFALSWIVMHPIDEDSPMFGKSPAQLAEAASVIVCTFAGTDDTLNATIYARHVYGPEDIRVGHRFVDVLGRNAAGDMFIDYERFHDTEAVEENLL